MELTYYRRGDYLFPNLVIEKQSTAEIGQRPKQRTQEKRTSCCRIELRQEV